MKRWVLWSVCAVAFGVAGCAVEKSENPLSPTVAGPIPGVEISTPALMQPSAGARINTTTQPISLSVGNANSSGVRPLSYTFEIATDAGFTSVVFSKNGVEPGPNGQTTFRLPDNLQPDRSYFWHARAEDGANTGAFSAPQQFMVFTPVVFAPPVLLSPTGNATTGSLKPEFKLANAARLAGTPDAVQYTIEGADSPSFAGSVVYTVPEGGGGQTVGVPDVDLPAGKQLFWRARAFDSSVNGPWSEVATFRTPAAAGGGGGGGGGGGTPGNTVGCYGGRLTDPKAYFFWLIGRKEGDPANDWFSVMVNSGLPNGPAPGQQAGSAFFGLTQQSGAGGPRGRVFLPTDKPDDFGYYTEAITILADVPGGLVWTWRHFDGPPYSPRPCS